MRKLLFLIILATLVACSKVPDTVEVNSTPPVPTPNAQSAVSNPSSPTPPLVLSTPTAESLPTSTIVITRVPTPTATAAKEAGDLSTFVDTWNSGNLDEIRSLYTPDARIFPESEIQKLSQDQSVDVLVSSPAFAERVEAHQGMTLRVLGEPISVYDKLVAYLYRWENNTAGYDGAALLRYENGKVFLHSLIESDTLTPNPEDDTKYVEGIDLDDMIQAWEDADLGAAQEIYGDDPIILSDEDLAQASWRDFHSPPKLDQLLKQFTGWMPVISETPKRIGDLAIFAWHWEAFNFPLGYGVRLVQLADTKIDTDLRYAIRPWEANGEPFLEP